MFPFGMFLSKLFSFLTDECIQVGMILPFKLIMKTSGFNAKSLGKIRPLFEKVS